MKRFTILIAFLVFVMGSIAVHAGGLGSNLIGKWKSKHGVTTEFLKGGMFVSIEGRHKLVGKYAIPEGNLLSVTIQGHEGICKASIQGSKLVFSTEYDCPWSGETLTRMN